MSIQLTKVSLGYDRSLYKNINLKLEKGRLIAIIGRNGSGKSTLLKTIAGIIPPLEGKIIVDDKILSHKEIPKYISVVLTEKPIDTFTVDEILKLGRLPYTDFMNKLSAKDKELIDKTIYRLKIEQIQHRIFSQLSDGEKQIVMIARAIVQDTPIILLDEPMTHLDLENKARVLKLLKELSDEGKLVLFSSHDLNLIIPVVNQFVILKDCVCIPESKEEMINSLKNLFENDLLIFKEKEMRFKMI
jgi:iron complex transport system ATP-binding protein